MASGNMMAEKHQVVDVSDDLEALKTKWKIPDDHVIDMKKKIYEASASNEDDTTIIIDFEVPTMFGKPFGKRIWWEFPKRGKDMRELIKMANKENPGMESNVVQYINTKTGETVKGPKYDTTTMEVDPRFKIQLKTKQQKPHEPMQYEPRDRFQENRNMNELNKFRNIINECLYEAKLEKNPKFRLKESLRSVVKEVLSEIANVMKPEPTDDEKKKIQKGFAKDGNERVDKTNENLLAELETIVHGIDPKWEVYWDDYNQLIVRAQNLLYVRILPRFENNFDIDAMVRLVDRVRAIGQTWDQVKAFVKANFGDLKKTKTDDLKQKAMDHHEDRDVIKKAAGPMGDAIKNRGEKKNGEDAKLGTTKRDDKDYREDDVKRTEDQPDQPMKQVTDPGKDPKSFNKNIEKTPKVKPPKNEKSPTELRPKNKATPKFRKKQIKP